MELLNVIQIIVIKFHFIFKLFQHKLRYFHYNVEYEIKFFSYLNSINFLIKINL